MARAIRLTGGVAARGPAIAWKAVLRSTHTRLSRTTRATPVAVAVVGVLVAVLVAVAWPSSVGAQQRRAVVVTDSILLGAQGPLVGRLQGAGWAVDFDGSVSRSTLAGVEAVRSHGLALSDTLVIGLGANDSANTATFRSRVDAVMAAAAAVPHVYWLTIREVRPYYAPANQVLRDAAARYPNLQIIDWNAAAGAAGGSTASDGLHLSPAGAQRLADLVAGTVTSGAAPAAQSPPVVQSAPAAQSAPASLGGAVAAPVAEEVPVAEPLPAADAAAPLPDPAAATTTASPFDRSAFVLVAPGGAPSADDVLAIPAAARGPGGRGGAWRWLIGAGVLLAGAYLVVSRLATRSTLAALLSGSSGPVRRAPLSRSELRAARIAGAQGRHPSTAVVAPVPDDAVPDDDVPAGRGALSGTSTTTL